MTRVVVCVDDRFAGGIAAALRRRGLTVERAAACGKTEAVARDGDCDVVVESCAAGCNDPTRCPYRHYAAIGTAVVLVGRPPAACALLGGSDSIPVEQGDDPEALSEAVAAHCREKTAEALLGSAPAADSEYAQYLNHELRTPLTAIQSALEILSIATPTAAGPDRVRLLEIVRSNLLRLRRSVAWSEEWCRLRAQGVPRQRSAWSLSELTHPSPDSASPRVTWSLDAVTAQRSVIANRAGVGLLVRQIEQALHCYAPAAEFQAQAAVATEAGNRSDTTQNARLELSWLPTGDPAAALQVGRVVRTQLVRCGQTPRDELARLIALTVNRRLITELDARIELCVRWAVLRPAVSVALPVALTESEPSVAEVC